MAWWKKNSDFLCTYNSVLRSTWIPKYIDKHYILLISFSSSQNFQRGKVCLTNSLLFSLYLWHVQFSNSVCDLEKEKQMSKDLNLYVWWRVRGRENVFLAQCKSYAWKKMKLWIKWAFYYVLLLQFMYR